jgi:hypothetical protein
MDLQLACWMDSDLVMLPENQKATYSVQDLVLQSVEMLAYLTAFDLVEDLVALLVLYSVQWLVKHLDPPTVSSLVRVSGCQMDSDSAILLVS